ncbi:isochorismatase family protein [Sulfurovum sp. NBC37-1]|uniref:isochorismatase family protein n=1 Tax=Sulfurovum sp. (strain NBC37-1) TaxID=387093 RepID=UPI0001587699|nr:isochorismatase family protein [Sulfurovum sp. NBC37-1]BAF71890.1 hypothetical protein SUN_0932 [Sulfurovum sp. NBC37-1]
MKKALIIIDMQNDYFPSGKMVLDGMNEALSNALSLINLTKEKNYEIFFIQHVSLRETASFFLHEGNGVKLYKAFNLENGTIIQKHYPNSFRETTYEKYIS